MTLAAQLRSYQAMSTVELLASGNAAMTCGALLGALEISPPKVLYQRPFLFGAGYPITPVNEVVDWGNRHFGALGADFIQAESEIAAANMAIGAAALGTPAFTATSSPGMSLMQEAVSYASALELGGLVFANIMRGGPGLGSVQGAQSDLLQAIGGAHGDARLIVLAPSSVQEMFDLTRLAFVLSARHRLPALILADGHVALMSERFTIDGDLGQGVQIQPPTGVQNSLFVNERALASHNWRLTRRFEQIAQDTQFREIAVKVHRAEEKDETEILIIAHGMFARCAEGIVECAQSRGIPVGLMTLRALSPFPSDAILAAARRHRALFVLEGSHGQLHSLVRQVCGGALPIGAGAYPGGVLPDEDHVCAELTRLRDALTPECDGMRSSAFEARDRCADLESRLRDPGRSEHDTLGLDESAHTLDLDHMRRGRSPAAEIMTDLQAPHCPGCGEPAAIAALGRVLSEVADLRPVLFPPVGCAVFTGDLFDPSLVDAIQVPHGRGPSAACAAKRVRPLSPVVALQGDGDALTIGGNELLHVIERGDPITLLILNNGLFGMTGGQMSATAPMRSQGAPLDLFSLTGHSGVAYFRRLIADDREGIAGLESVLRNALAHQMAGNGLSVVEVLTACPTHQVNECDESARQFVHESLAKAFPLDRRRGEDFDNPIESIRSAVREKGDTERSIARVDLATRCLETMQSLHGFPNAATPHLTSDITIFVGGRGGQGVQTLARVMQCTFAGACESTTLLPWYGPEVRSGITHARLRLNSGQHHSPDIGPGEADLFLCLDPAILEGRTHMIREGRGLLVYDSGLCPDPSEGKWDSLGISATEIAQREFGSKRHAGMILLGHALARMNLAPLDVLKPAIWALCPDPENNWRALCFHRKSNKDRS